MPATIVDTHCHLYWPSLKVQAEKLVEDALEAGMRYIVVPGLDLATSLEAQELARKYESVYYAAGVHPAEALKNPDFCARDFFAWFEGDPKLVGVGEIGLDAHRTREVLPQQVALLLPQLEYAAYTGLPVILHHRDAGKDLIEEVGKFPGLRGVFHCFDGSRKLLKYASENGLYIGVAGNVTYETAHSIHSQLSAIPEDRLVAETDAPFMPPGEARGRRECVPADVAETIAVIARKLALLENMLRIRTSRNSCKLFGLPGDANGA
jgi:TatD DNase family protein